MLSRKVQGLASPVLSPVCESRQRCCNSWWCYHLYQLTLLSVSKVLSANALLPASTLLSDSLVLPASTWLAGICYHVATASLYRIACCCQLAHCQHAATGYLLTYSMVLPDSTLLAAIFYHGASIVQPNSRLLPGTCQLITASQHTACQCSLMHLIEVFHLLCVIRSLTAGLSAVPCHVFYCVMIKVGISYASHRDNALPVPVYKCIFNATPYAL